MMAPQKNNPIAIIKIGLSNIQFRSIAPSFNIQAKSFEKIPSISSMVAVEPLLANAGTQKMEEKAAIIANNDQDLDFFLQINKLFMLPP